MYDWYEIMQKLLRGLFTDDLKQVGIDDVMEGIAEQTEMHGAGLSDGELEAIREILEEIDNT